MELDIKQIKTLYSIFKVSYQKGIRWRNKKVSGYIKYNDEEILIDLLNSFNRQIQALMHESLHSILFDLKIELNDDLTDMLALALVKFIQENPELINIILKERGE